MKRIQKRHRLRCPNLVALCIVGVTLVLAGTFCPAQRRSQDPWYAAQPGSEDERIVVSNASSLFQWYTAFVVQRSTVFVLPVALTGTSQGEIFTVEEALHLGAELPSKERTELENFINGQLSLLKRQTELQGGTLTELPPTVFFANPLVLENDKDLLEYQAKLEDLARVREGVAALVSYKLYKQKRRILGSVPTSMELFIRLEYERLRNALGPKEQMKLEGMTVKVSDAPGEEQMLWLGTCSPSFCKEIRLSPLLARTMYMQVLRDAGQAFINSYQRYIHGGGNPGAIQNGFSAASLRRTPQGRQLLTTLREIPDRYNVLMEKFRESLDFPLAHEMAHVYLGDGQVNEQSEERCDQAALAHLKLVNKKVALGAFETLLDQAMKEGSADLWGLEKDSEGGERLKKRIDLLKRSAGGK